MAGRRRATHRFFLCDAQETPHRWNDKAVAPGVFADFPSRTAVISSSRTRHPPLSPDQTKVAGGIPFRTLRRGYLSCTLCRFTRHPPFDSVGRPIPCLCLHRHRPLRRLRESWSRMRTGPGPMPSRHRKGRRRTRTALKTTTRTGRPAPRSVPGRRPPGKERRSRFRARAAGPGARGGTHTPPFPGPGLSAPSASPRREGGDQV